MYTFLLGTRPPRQAGKQFAVEVAPTSSRPSAAAGGFGSVREDGESPDDLCDDRLSRASERQGCRVVSRVRKRKEVPPCWAVSAWG